MPKPVEIQPSDYSDYATEQANSAQRAREVAAARLQGRPKQSMATEYASGSDGSSSLVQRRALNETPISRDEF